MAGLTREQKAAREAAAAQAKSVSRDEDERVRTDTADDRVIRDSGAEVRGDRGFEEDAARETPMTDDEIEAMIAAEFEQTRLPSPPKLPGWHLCWLTTTSQYDSIHNRARIGYVLVRQEELPGFDPNAGQGLERYPGVVTCNEMVLAKIEERRYQALMRVLHHKKPLQEEEGIVNNVRSQASQKDSSGRAIVTIEGDGLDAMEESIRRGNNLAPTFS